MYKIVVTSQLSKLLRERRIEKGLTAKTLAEKLGLKTAHLSKIENGLIKTITPSLFQIFIDILYENNSEEETLRKIYNSLEYWYSKEEIDKQLWLINFDTVRRQIPLSLDLVKDLREKMKQNNIKLESLLVRMNSNEALTVEQKNNESYEFNRWFIPDKTHPEIKIIRIKITKESLENILSGKLDKISFIPVFCTAFYINKIIQYKDRIELSKEEYSDLMIQTENYLEQYDFITLNRKNIGLRKASTDEEFKSILTKYDKENIAIIQNIVEALKYASDLDIKLTNTRLSSFVENLKWDIGFMLKIVSLDYSKEVNTFDKKKRLLEEIEKTVKNYQNKQKNSQNKPRKLSDY